MKLRLSLLAAAVATLSAPIFAASALELYGKVNLTLQQTDVENPDVTKARDVIELKSNASRFGIKGELPIDEDFAAFYQVEWEVDPADNDKGSTDNIKSRNQGIGLKAGFGQMLVGRWDTPFKNLQQKVDQFHDYDVDPKALFSGEARANNVVAYSSPKIAGGLQFNLMTLLQEKNDSPAVTSDDDQDGAFDALSYSVEWHGKSLYLGLAIDDNHDTAKYLDGARNTRLSAQYKIGDFQLGAMWQEFEEQTGTDTNKDGKISDNDGILASVAWNLNENNTLKLQHGQSDILLDGGEQTLVGFDHKFARNVMLFGFAGEITQDATDHDRSYLASGLEVKF